MFILPFLAITMRGQRTVSHQLRDVHGEEALKDRQCRNWFDKFRFGDFPLKDEQRFGRPNEDDV